MMCEFCNNVMLHFNVAIGPQFVCIHCGRMRSNVINSPFCPVEKRPNACPCDQCAFMDLTERYDSEGIDGLIVGRCLNRGYRIMPEEGPCELFVGWNSEERKTLERGVDVYKICSDILASKKKAEAKVIARRMSKLDYWAEAI